eukprot:PLAT7673.1.p3 GENE.PLAT7673.1~~PLAT7673.1.p3  ORF type:complete len:131 (-),score=33.72 PLAT7673.1:38-430(-)
MATNPRVLFVGGLDKAVSEEILMAAFLPFGEISDVRIPSAKEKRASKEHRGYGFVTFVEEEDAREAIDNMDDAELYGRVLKVNIAKPERTIPKDRPIWETEADTLAGAASSIPVAAPGAEAAAIGPARPS